jgi:uncharacterized protein YjbI with pentapeptide repeats
MRINCKKRDCKISDEICELRKTRQISFATKKKELIKRNKPFPNEIIGQTIHLDNCDYQKGYATFEYKSYCFVLFEESKYGRSAAFSEDDYIVISDISFYYVKFINCRFDNIIFDGCKFIGSEFQHCMTHHGKIIFQNCVLRSTELHPNENYSIKNISTEFSQCTMSILLKSCLGDYLIFDSCQLMLSSFDSCEMPNSIFEKCGFYSVKFINSDINKLKIISSTNYDLEFFNILDINNVDNEIYVSFEKEHFSFWNRIQFVFSSLKEKKLIKNLQTNRNLKLENYHNMAKMYFTLSKLLNKNNINDELSREYTYLYNYFSMKIKKSYWDKFIFFLSWILCGFGERMGRFLVWFTLFIVSTTFAYMLGGVSVGQNKIIQYTIIGGSPVPFHEMWEDFLLCLHFSIVTFSTVGYGNITPYGWSYFISAIQIIVGIIFVAILTSVIVKKLLK